MEWEGRGVFYTISLINLLSTLNLSLQLCDSAVAALAAKKNMSARIKNNKNLRRSDRKLILAVF
jgi:hypothetical protein